MKVLRAIWRAGLKKVPAELYESPWHLLLILILSIFLAQAGMMALLYFFLPLPRIMWNIPHPQLVIPVVVPASLVLFLFPSLVFFVLRPLRLNIRERRNAEEALAGKERNFRSLAENSPDVIMRFDRQLRYLYINPAGEKRMGLPSGSLRGRTNSDIGMSQELSALWDREISRTFADAEPATVEITYPLPDNSCFEARLVPEISEPGKVHSVLVISRDITQRKKVEAELRASQERLRLFSCHLQAAREEERTKIAREIHDELGQVLAAMAMEASWLESELPEEQTDLREKAASISELTRSTIKTVQRVSAELRPVMLDDLGLAAAVQWHVREFQKRTGIACSLHLSLDGDGPDRERSTALFRILQEALTNVLRHARATRVKVNLTGSEDRVILKVSDNGRGATRKEIEDRLSLGVLGMRERAMFWGGEVEIRGLRQRGTTVTVTIPLASEPMPGTEGEEFIEFGWASREARPQLHLAAY